MQIHSWISMLSWLSELLALLQLRESLISMRIHKHETMPKICVTNWHFSRSFRLIFFNTYDPYIPRSILSDIPHSFRTISPAHSIQQITENVCIESHNIADTTFILQWMTCFKTRRNTSSMDERPKAQARQQDQLPPPGSENPPYRSAGS